MKRSSLTLRLPRGRDLGIQLAMVSLNIIGLFMVVSASMTTRSDTNDLMFTFVRQLAFIVVGYLGYVGMARLFSFERLRPLIVPIVFGSLFFSLVPLLFPEVNGARAWIPLPYIGSLQPSEFLKIAIIWILCMYLGDVKVKKVKTSDIIKIPFFTVSALIFIVLVPQSDLGSAVIMALIALAVFMSSASKRYQTWQWSLFVMIIVGVGLASYVLSPGGVSFLRDVLNLPAYMVARFENTLNPFVNRYGSGYQLVNSLVAFVRGGWFGVGYGQGLQKYGYLPAARTDFILAVIGEEFGFVGVFTVMSLYTILVFSLLRYAWRAKEDKPRMVLVGVAMYVFSHFLLNVSGAIAFLPLTGVPLLMLSSGGSSTVSIMMALGMAQAIIVKMKKVVS